MPIVSDQVRGFSNQTELPRERLLQRGGQSLTDSEILSILIGTGSRRASCQQIAASAPSRQPCSRPGGQTARHRGHSWYWPGQTLSNQGMRRGTASGQPHRVEQSVPSITPGDQRLVTQPPVLATQRGLRRRLPRWPATAASNRGAIPRRPGPDQRLPTGVGTTGPAAQCSLAHPLSQPPFGGGPAQPRRHSADPESAKHVGPLRDSNMGALTCSRPQRCGDWGALTQPFEFPKLADYANCMTESFLWLGCAK